MIRQHLLRDATRTTSNTFRQRPIQLRNGLLITKRFASEAGENKSGHIATRQNEGILFFNSLIPLNLQWFYKLAWSGQKRAPILLQAAKEHEVGAVSPARVLEDVVKSGKLSNVDTVEVLPRLKEGGAFLKFSHGQETDVESVSKAVRDHLKQKPIKPWFNPFSRVTANLVLGKPWVEDLFRLPTPRLRVEFLPTEPGQEAAELGQEQLYSFFRPYGKLAEYVFSWRLCVLKTDAN